MSKIYNIFIFFRDLRLKDNTGLIQAQKLGYKNILPIFIFIDEQIDPKKNKYFSNNSVQFLCEGLLDLHRNLNSKNKELYLFHSSKIINVLESILKNIKIQGIHFNQDYTNYAMNRQKNIMKWCNKNKIDCCVYEDYLLSKIGTFNKKDNTVYGVYGPFKNNVYSNIGEISLPKNTFVSSITTSSSIRYSNFYIPIKSITKFYELNPNKLVLGNIKDALKLLRKTTNMNYEDNRNDMTFTTSLLSAYIKYGILSIRDVFHYFQKNKQYDLSDQLIWREFYFYVCYYNPDILKYSKNYNSKYDKIVWVNNKKHYKAWCEGNTGYPIIDACIKQLNTTGYMHNRGRLISANFLNRILGMDWRLGEKYFANKLTDYDPCVNNGNWQWIASTGVDTKPYFQRLFNPWLQSKKFDVEALYIKKWIPELKDIPPKHIHEWNKYYQEHSDIDYPKPIVEHNIQRKKALELFKNL